MPRTFDALETSQRLAIVCAIAFTAAAGLATAAGADDIARFALSGLALAAVAAVVGQSLEQVGEYFGPGPTGLLQSSLGNLPELFVAVFALREGLTAVVQSALVGSVLANVLLVLGVAFLSGGARFGTQKFRPEAPRMLVTLLTLAVGALLVPTLAARLETPAAHHTEALSDVTAVVLFLVYVASIPFWLAGGPISDSQGQPEPKGANSPQAPAGGNSPVQAVPAGALPPQTSPAPTSPALTSPAQTSPTQGSPAQTPPTQGSRSGVSPSGTWPAKSSRLRTLPTPTSPPDSSTRPPSTRPPSTGLTPGHWPLGMALVVLVIAGAASAAVSDWFVSSLVPATHSLGISPEFTGLVIVAIASNAVENFAGVRFAWKARSDYAVSTILNSPLQIALLLTPILVLASNFFGPHQLTLVFPPLLVAALAVAVVVAAVVIYDGEYSWLEGVALIALYAIVAAAFWWG